MIYLLYQNKKNTLEELFLHAYFQKSIDEFSTWMLEKIDQNIIQVVNSNTMTKDQFIKHQVASRKHRIQELLVTEYLKAAHARKKKQRKVIREAYKKTEQYAHDYEEALRTDSTIKKLADEEYTDRLYAEYLQRGRTENLEKIQEDLDLFCDSKREEILGQMITEEIFYQYQEELTVLIKDQVGRYLQTEACISDSYDENRKNIILNIYSETDRDYKIDEKDGTEDIEFFIYLFMDDPELMVSDILYSAEFLDGYLGDFFFDKIPCLTHLKDKESWRWIFFNLFDYELHSFKMDLLMDADFTALYVLENLMKNPLYQEQANAFYEKKRRMHAPDYLTQEEFEMIKKKEQEMKMMVRQRLISRIPERYKDLYPLARQMQRKFYLHLGPTNSGKTYHALEALRKNASGIYLAPLRLLAHEQYEKMNKDGYPCSLITGEEKKQVPCAVFQSSTIEMANFTTHYSTAVIDEAQMISDKDRGGAWTAAILGVCADEIHICAAPYAKDILIRLIEECGDPYEIITYERDIPLVVETEKFDFPKDVRENDALIVFSKRKVHIIAAELQRTGRKCSIIYGSLPYDVRQEEARKFWEGETQVLVSTDAIGMGMNLPIRRIIFLETSKYDGSVHRPLKPEEIQQIAGRAGRKGMYGIGLVNSTENIQLIRNGIHAVIPSVEEAALRFSEALLGIDAPLSVILERWNYLESNKGYKKENVIDQIHLCRSLEIYTDDKQMIYRFISIPFDSNNYRLRWIWLSLFKGEMDKVANNYKKFLPDMRDVLKCENLNYLEEDHKVCELLWIYMERFHWTEEYQDIIEVKSAISKRISMILDRRSTYVDIV